MTTTAPRHIVLIGMMGVGKSTVGKKLAATLTSSFVDLDGEIEAVASKTIPEIFASEGEHGFRLHEADALAVALSRSDPIVVATGGGVVDGPAASLLRQHCCVWLTASVQTLADRVGTGKGRPLLGDDVVGTLTTLLERRDAKYAEVATLTIAVDDQSVSAIVAQLMSQLEALC